MVNSIFLVTLVSSRTLSTLLTVLCAVSPHSDSHCELSGVQCWPVQEVRPYSSLLFSRQGQIYTSYMFIVQPTSSSRVSKLYNTQSWVQPKTSIAVSSLLNLYSQVQLKSSTSVTALYNIQPQLHPTISSRRSSPVQVCRSGQCEDSSDSSDCRYGQCEV